FSLGIERTDDEGASTKHWGHVEQIGREKHQGNVLHQDRKPHGGEDHYEVGLVQSRADDQAVDHAAEQEHGGHDGRDCNVGVETEISGYGPSAVHRDHKEFAMGEVHDTQDTEYECQAHAHQRVDAADEQAGKNKLADGRHRLQLEGVTVA